MELRGQSLSLTDLAAVALEAATVKVSKSARSRIFASRQVIDRIVARNAVVYGVNTGFGKLSDVRIRPGELRDLQLNLVRSHACGIGPPLSEPEVRAMMLLRANVLTLGFSGIRLEVIEMLCEMLNRGLHPVVPEKGSVGASDARLQNARPHTGQKNAAAHLLFLLKGSQIRKSHLRNDPRIQDAYSLRCMPQVHGAARGALTHCEEILLTESESATDNPLVFENGDVITGGNFHGAPLALALDYAAIALTDLMSMSERRTDRMLNPDKSDGLPAFLARRPGLQSGFMIAHVAVASLLNEARILAHPASVDNVTTSAGKEDHVSMGMTAALKFRKIVDLAEDLFAVELLAAAEGLEHRRPLKAGVGVERAFAVVREIVPPLTEDRSLSADIARVAGAIRRGDFDSGYEKL